VRHDESIAVNIDTGGANKSDAPPLPKNRPRAYLHVDPFRARALFTVASFSRRPSLFTLHARRLIGQPRRQEIDRRPLRPHSFFVDRANKFSPPPLPLILSRERGERAARLGAYSQQLRSRVHFVNRGYPYLIVTSRLLTSISKKRNVSDKQRECRAFSLQRCSEIYSPPSLQRFSRVDAHS